MPSVIRFPHFRRAQIALLALALPIAAYGFTLQRHIAGSFNPDQPGGLLKNEYIKDVGEIQVAVNVWGTIHHTGYPLYAILGNLFTLPFRVVGVEPAAAASLYALTWGIVMLAAFGLLIARLTGRSALALIGTALLALTRSIWIHNVVAEVYSMSLAITMLMLLVALWPAPWTGRWSAERRLFWLALLGGIGVAHHRAVAFVAPGLIGAVWPHLWAERARWRRWLPILIGLALLGFVPYIYLPLRSWMGGEWVYGEPGTWRGFWIEFRGQEASYLVKLPGSAGGWIDNARDTWAILAKELTLPGLLIGLIGLGSAAVLPAPSTLRRAVWVMILCAAGPTLFAIAYHTAVLPEAVLMPTVLALVFGVTLAANHLPTGRVQAAVMAGMVAWTAALFAAHYDLVHELVSENSGVETIKRLEQIPREGKSALMLPWGPRYSAAVYSRLVTGENADVIMVDHKGDYRKLFADGYHLYTEPETFYTYPLPWQTALPVAPSNWWRDHLGDIYLSSAAPGLVQIFVAPPLAEADSTMGIPITDGISRQAAWLTCDSNHVELHVIWQADTIPTRDWSVFVHLTPDEPIPNPPNADSRYSVNGLYPSTRWQPGQIVRDDFTLPRLSGYTQVRFGLYEQESSGQFVNYGETVLPIVGCEDS